jgi:hypothetical protein
MTMGEMIGYITILVTKINLFTFKNINDLNIL